MIRVIFIFGFLFTIGNIIWPMFNEPKIFYVPLALFIFSLLIEVRSRINIKNYYEIILVQYFIFLAGGNIVKQLFYTERIKQANDFIWGGIVTIWLIYKLIDRWDLNRRMK